MADFEIRLPDHFFDICSYVSVGLPIPAHLHRELPESEEIDPDGGLERPDGSG